MRSIKDFMQRSGAGKVKNGPVPPGGSGDPVVHAAQIFAPW